MTHLTKEQLEDILQGYTAEPEHLAQCAQCRARLAEQKALAARLKSALNSVQPPADLIQKIRSQTTAGSSGSSPAPRILRFRDLRTTWKTALSAVAAIVILAPVLILYLKPTPAHAAALVQIHQHNLSETNDFFSASDPNKLAAYFKEKLGFDPMLPQLEHGLQLRGCCVRHFQGDIVGSYVVDTPEGIISVIVVSDLPQDLGMNKQSEAGSPYVFWTGHFARCHIVSTRIKNYTYCAVGQMTDSHLRNLLSRLLQDDGGEPA